MIETELRQAAYAAFRLGLIASYYALKRSLLVKERTSQGFFYF